MLANRIVECAYFLSESDTWILAGEHRAVMLTRRSADTHCIQVDVVATVAGRVYMGSAVGDAYLSTFDLALQDLYASTVARTSPPPAPTYELGVVPIYCTTAS